MVENLITVKSTFVSLLIIVKEWLWQIHSNSRAPPTTTITPTPHMAQPNNCLYHPISKNIVGTYFNSVSEPLPHAWWPRVQACVFLPFLPVLISHCRPPVSVILVVINHIPVAPIPRLNDLTLCILLPLFLCCVSAYFSRFCPSHLLVLYWWKLQGIHVHAPGSQLA